MTLEEFKLKVYTLIEEYNEDSEDYTEDTDLAAKMNHVINEVMNEVARYKKIPARATRQVKFSAGETEQEVEMSDIDEMMYQVNVIRGVESQVIGKTIIFKEEGTAKIYYFKYPEPIGEDTEDEYEFELDTDALECMVNGVAADLLQADVASNYGRVYAQRYKEQLQRLDSRSAMGNMFFDGGVEL